MADINLPDEENTNQQMQPDRQNEDLAEDNFCLIFNPLLRTLRGFGLFFYYRKTSSLAGRWSIDRVYCTVMMMLILGSLMKSLAMYKDPIDFGPVLFLKLINTSWVSTCDIYRERFTFIYITEITLSFLLPMSILCHRR